MGESWSKDCIVALQRQVSNRILRIEIQGAHEGKALVALIDEGSDPQVNVAELLTSAGFSVPASAMGGGDHQLEQKAVISAKKQGGDRLQLKILPQSHTFYSELFKAAHSHAGSEAEIKADVKGNESNQEQVQPASQAGGLQQEPAAAAAATAPELQPDCVWLCGEIQQRIDGIAPKLNVFPQSCCSSIFPSHLEDSEAAIQGELPSLHRSCCQPGSFLPFQLQPESEPLPLSFSYPYLPLADRIAIYFYWLDTALQRTSRNLRR